MTSGLPLTAAILLLGAAFGNCGYAGTLATYPFSSNLNSSGVDPNVTVQLDISNLSTGYIGTDGFGNVLEAYPKAGSTTAGTALSNGSYFSVTMSADSGFLLNLSSLAFDANAGDDFGVHGAFVRSSVDGFSTDLIVPTLAYANPATQIVSLGSSFQNLSSVTYRFYQYTGTPSSWSNDFRNVVISGTADPTGSAVPEPSSFGLFLIGAAGLALARLKSLRNRLRRI